ncbi:DUF2004 domain-containing protein [Epilithonimonas sp.]|uniref:DUF2004 domain-containing protein n=1 Tax=Epilithonimonas sp. TaxID=2894511 RepID=UPI00289D45F3|nr:DUF2004 domain-containing protein [Epilithonimonas sp.]
MKIFLYISLITISCSNTTSAQKNNIKYFETVNFKNLKEEYITKTVTINKDKVNIDLNFDNKNPSENELKTLNSFFSNLENIIQQNKSRIDNDFKSSEENTVREYISHHLSEIPENELNQLIDRNDKIKSDEQKLFEKIKLKRIGIYPKDNINYGTFDYTIGETYTQYLIVIKINEKGKIIDVTIES